MADTINIQNYEAYFLDFIEGNLDASLQKELDAFLNKHPELKQELEDFEMFTLEAETIEYTKKEALSINTKAKYFDISDTEYLSIASIEKDISVTEQKQLENKIRNDEWILSDLTLYIKANLIPDTSIVFEKKKELFKQHRVLNLRIASLAAAAVFAGVVALNITGVFNTNQNTFGDQLFSGNRISAQAPLKTSESQTEKESVQGALISHNQTNKQTSKNDLVFAENESPINDNTYKENTVQIPDIKQEALFFSEINNKAEMILAHSNSSNQRKNEKEILWDIAEKGVSVFKLLSSSELEMNNQYYADGTIEKLKISHPNFKLSRTFNKIKQ